MSYSRYRDVAELVAYLGAYSRGLTITQMMEHTNKSRASVERLLAILDTMDLIEEAERTDFDHHRTKRWVLSDAYGAKTSMIANLETAERADIERLFSSLENSPARSGLAKLLSKETRLGLAAMLDLDENIERDASVGRVGPTHTVSIDTRNIIDHAIRAFQKVQFTYGSSKAKLRSVSPAGLQFGRFTYLVGFEDLAGPKTYRLDLVENMALSQEPSNLPHDWNFKDWSSSSFGVYHGDTQLKVVLHFDAKIADRISKVQLHSSQHNKVEEDGSVTVTLSCCGHRELLHELMHPDWAGNVRIISPHSLVDELKQYLDIIQTKHG